MSQVKDNVLGDGKPRAAASADATERRAAEARNRRVDTSGAAVPGPNMPTVKGYVVQRRKGQSVYDWLRQYAQQAGLGSLSDTFVGIVKSYGSGANISASDIDRALVDLRKTPEYANRFPGMASRDGSPGLSNITEGQYVQLESDYRQVLHQAGLPAGFYDDASDFASWIANDVSPAEIQQRASMAEEIVHSKDPSLLATMKDYYGLDKGDLVAYYLDSDRALPALEKKYQAAQIGAEADRAGLHSSRKHSTELADLGITQDQARVAYGDTARDADRIRDLQAMQGVAGQHTKRKTSGNGKIADAKLGVDADTAKSIRTAEGYERSRFRGSGSGTRGLGPAGGGSF